MTNVANSCSSDEPLDLSLKRRGSAVESDRWEQSHVKSSHVLFRSDQSSDRHQCQNKQQEQQEQQQLQQQEQRRREHKHNPYSRCCWPLELPSLLAVQTAYINRFLMPAVASAAANLAASSHHGGSKQAVRMMQSNSDHHNALDSTNQHDLTSAATAAAGCLLCCFPVSTSNVDKRSSVPDASTIKIHPSTSGRFSLPINNNDNDNNNNNDDVSTGATARSRRRTRRLRHLTNPDFSVDQVVRSASRMMVDSKCRSLRGQNTWMSTDRSPLYQILRCLVCNESFETLAGLTNHLTITNHYDSSLRQMPKSKTSSGNSDDNDRLTNDGNPADNNNNNHDEEKTMDADCWTACASVGYDRPESPLYCLQRFVQCTTEVLDGDDSVCNATSNNGTAKRFSCPESVPGSSPSGSITPAASTRKVVAAVATTSPLGSTESKRNNSNTLFRLERYRKLAQSLTEGNC